MATWSSEDDFAKVLTVAEALFKNKKITVRFGPTGKAQFIIDDTALKGPLAESGIDESVFRRVFNNEIGPMIESGVQGQSAETFARRRMVQFGQVSDETAQAEFESKARQRAELISTRLLSAEMRARYQIKISSKHAGYQRLTWEVSEKRFESTSESPISLPYVTLSLESVRPERNASNILAWLPFITDEAVGRTEYSTFDADEEDLDELIRKLQLAKAALMEAKAGGKDD
jgi:hypothetical protein